MVKLQILLKANTMSESIQAKPNDKWKPFFQRSMYFEIRMDVAILKITSTLPLALTKGTCLQYPQGLQALI